VIEKQPKKGFTAGLSAYLIWGSFPIIISFLSFATAFEVVVWRIVFGFLASLVLITVTRHWGSVTAVMRQPKMMLWILVAAIFIMVNWQVYVIGVASGHVIETSLGYFINPIVTIALAVVFLRERLRPAQWVAVGVAAVAVIILTVDYGHLPWIALTLAASFSIYGLAKNKLGGKVSALNSFAFESGILLPVALIQFLLVASTGPGIQFASHGFWGSFGLVFFGVMTAIPLILFGTAARHLSLSTIGFMQFMTPIIQFSLGLFYFGEEMPLARWIGFVLVWLALAFLIVDMLRRRSKR
jgi:chloramphenicol-sensitive protein RarD